MQIDTQDIPEGGKWIFAYLYDNDYQPENITDLERLNNLEYSDAKGNEYQLWHWPSGGIFSITPDRDIEPENEYATPYSSKGVLWLPVLNKVGTDKDKVDRAFINLSN